MLERIDEWTRRVDVLCRQHLACDWQDLSGDHEPLERGYQAGQEPSEFVCWFAEKYALTWTDTTASTPRNASNGA